MPRLAAGLLLLTTLLWAGLHTRPGLDAAAFLASRFYSLATGMHVRIEAVSGSVPTDFTVGRLAVADGKGVWLIVKDLRFAWSPLALLRGRMLIHALTADIVRVRREPVVPRDPNRPPQLEWPPRFPSLPPILVDALSVNRLILDAALVGQDAVLHVAGRLAESGQGAVAVHCTATRLDGPPLVLTAAGSLNYAAWRLAAKAKLTDGPGGLLATALAGPSAGPLVVELTGDGPLDAWQGRFAAQLAGKSLLAADLGLRVPLNTTATASWSLSGEVSPPAEGMPAGAIRLIGEHCDLDLAGRVGLLSGALFLDRAAVRTAVGTLAATAALDPEKNTLASRIALTIPQADRLDPTLTGAIEATATLSGRLERPDCTLTVTADKLRSGPIGLETATLTAKAAFAGDLGGDFPGASITAEGTLAGLSGPAGATLLGRDLRLRLGAGLAATGALTVREGVLTGSGGTIRIQGDRSPAGDLTGSLTAEQGNAGITVVRLAGSGSYASATDRLEVKATATANDLAGLESALGTRLTGKLSLDATLSGPMQALELTLTGQARDLTAASVRLDRLDIAATASPLSGQPAGRLRLTASRDRETAGLECGFALVGQRLTLSALRLTAPETALTGQLGLDLAQGTVSGNLDGTSANLSGLGRFLGLPLAGSLKLAATADASSRSGQQLAATITASGLAVAGCTARELSLAASLDHLRDLPRGKAHLTAKGVTGGGLDLANLRLDAVGDGRNLETTADIRGALPSGQPLRLAATTRLTTTGQSRTLTVAALSGNLANHAFSLGKGASLTFAGGSVRLAPLTLALDKARLTASGNFTPTSVAATASLEGFPLPLLALVGGLTGFEGTAGATASLSGSPAHPRLAAKAHLDGVKLVAEGGQSLPAMTVLASATLENGRLALTTSLAGTGKKAIITAQAALPARFSLSPWALDLPPSGAITGRLTADGNLADVAAPLAQVDTRLVGSVKADVSLTGTLAAPSLAGSLRLTGSRLENADTGLVLRDIEVQLDASNDKIVLTKVTGRDLKGGRLTVTGAIGPFAAGDAPVAIAAQLTHLKVAGLDLVTATADGNITLSGSLAHMTARGALALGPVDVNLPPSLPPDVVVIPVTAINDPHAQPAATNASSSETAKRLDLDIKVTLGQAVFVRGMGIESRWGGNVVITGTADAPLGQGRLFVERGKVELFGGDLDITKGELVFDGQSVLAPRITILASTTNDDVTAGVSLTGDAASPTIALFSTPMLPDNEILSRILFGQSASGLAPLQAAQLAQAAASLYTGGAPTSILARTRRILGLDQLNLISSGKGDIPSAVLRAGKEIVKGVTVGVEQGMEAQSGAVSVEVKITPNITVDSRVGDDNKQGVGVNWKWDY